MLRKIIQSKLFYNHSTQSVISLGSPCLDQGRVIGYYVRGVRKRYSAVYSLDVICDTLEYGFASRSNGLTLELIN